MPNAQQKKAKTEHEQLEEIIDQGMNYRPNAQILKGLSGDRRGMVNGESEFEKELRLERERARRRG